jgi:membrane-associated protease RseP (regulator of RpoE activity)
MRLATSLFRAGLLCAFAITLATFAAVRADEPKPAEAKDPPEARRVIVNFSASSKYWLDMKLTNVSKALDAQLGLDGAGALVTDVGGDGPAAKAGVKAHDILLAVGDKPIEKLSDVLDEVEKSLGKEVSLKVLRAGKEMTLAITPVERSAAPLPRTEIKTNVLTLRRLGDLDIEFEKLEEKIRDKLDNAGLDVRMLLIEPGKFIPHGTGFEVDKPADLPDDLSVQITKTGKKPAQIEVKQGDKTWTVTEEKLDELPEEVRGHVKSLLGRSPVRFTLSVPGATFIQPPDIQTRQRIRGALERRIDEMNRDLSRMRERMDSLRDVLRDLDRGDKPSDDR